MKKVKITLRSVTEADGTRDEQTLCYEGEYDRKNEADYLKYSELTDGAKINTVIKATESVAVITRSGGVGSVLRIECGKIYKTEYKTPYGVFSMAVKGERCENALSQRGSLNIGYTLLNDGGVIGKNKIEINIKEV